MSVTVEKYMETVQVVAVPIKGTEVHHPKGGLGEGTLFWLHTVGMGQYDRPEIEMYNVPALYLADAAGTVNHWAHYSIDHEIGPGENIQSGPSSLHPILTLEESADEHDFWSERGVSCLRIVLGAVLFECAGCGECDGHTPDEMVH
jgi:hypothetical protein